MKSRVGTPAKTKASRVSRSKPLKLEVGQVYCRLDGYLTDPLTKRAPGFLYDAKHGNEYHLNGKAWLCSSQQEHNSDLIAVAYPKETPPTGSAKRLEDLVSRVLTELSNAQVSFPPFNSLHEGFSVLKEEVDELWDEVKKKQFTDKSVSTIKDLGYERVVNEKRIEGAKREAVQIAAMALRLILDCCEPGSNGYGK